VSKLSERQRLILTILVTVLVTGGLVALIFSDRGEIDQIEQEIGELDSRIQAADVEIRRTPEREEQVIVFRAVEDTELAVLPTQQKIADFHRGLSTFLASAGLKFRELPESIPVESGLAAGIYVTRTVLSCQGDSASLLKFLNMMENDPRLVAVKGLKVKAGMKDPRNPDVALQHDVEVHLETYFYNPKTIHADRVHIPNEEARLQEPAIKEAIASFQPERPDTYVLRPATSRRDPLVDPRKSRPKMDPEAMREAWEREETIVIDLENRMADVNEKVEQEKALLAVGKLFEHDRLYREVDVLLNEVLARLSQVDQMKTVVIPDLVLRVEAVRSRIDELGSRRPQRDLAVTASVAEGTLADVRTAFESGSYSEVATLTSAWNTYLQGKKVHPDAMDTISEIARLRAKAKTLADFQTITIKVTGTIVDLQDPRRSVALVNARPLRAGDTLEDRTEVVVGRVLRDGVEFQFRGETIFVGREKGASPSAPREAAQASLPRPAPDDER
jgi:Tfp pilus assembly protein PilO